MFKKASLFMKDLELEQKIINYLWHDAKYWSIAITKLKNVYFEDMRVVYDNMLWYYNTYRGLITVPILRNKLVEQNTDSSVMTTIKATLKEGLNFPINDEAEFTYLCDSIINKYKRDKTLSLAMKIADTNPRDCSEEELNKLHNIMQKTLIEVNSTEFDVSREGDVGAEAMERLKEYQHIKEHPEDLKLIKTGFTHIDNAIVGWGYGTSNWVAGRKGDGKSVFLLNIAYHLWTQGINVLLFSLEIDKSQYLRRWDARCARVSSKGLKAGTLEPEEEKMYEKYLQNSLEGKNVFGDKCGKFYIVDCPSKVTPAFIEAKTEEIQRKTDTVYDAIVIDYAGIMAPNVTYGTLREDLGQLSLELKQFARNTNKILFSAVQMNREGKKRMEDKKVNNTGTEAVADSDAIANHLDTLFAIFSVDDNYAVIESLKNRDGSYFKFNIEKQYDKMLMIEADDSAWDSI